MSARRSARALNASRLLQTLLPTRTNTEVKFPVILDPSPLRREGLILLVAQACLVECEVAPVDVLAQAASVVEGLDEVGDLRRGRSRGQAGSG